MADGAEIVTPASNPAGGDDGAAVAAAADASENAEIASADVASESEFAEVETLPPLNEPVKKSRGRPRKAVKRRKMTVKEKRERKKQRAAAAELLAAEIGKDVEIKAASAAAAADAAPAPVKVEAAKGEAAAKVAPLAPSAEAFTPVLSDAEMAAILGLAFVGVAKVIPEGFGGGTLSTDERELLGRAWYAYAKPYVASEGGPLGVAIGATVQVFALRALTASMKPDAAKVPAAANVAESGESAPVKSSASDAPAASAAPKHGLVEPVNPKGEPRRKADKS